MRSISGRSAPGAIPAFFSFFGMTTFHRCYRQEMPALFET